MTRLRICLVLPGIPIERDEPGLAAVVDTVERIAAVHDVEIVALRHPPRRAAYEMAGATVHALGLARLRGPRGRSRVLAHGMRTVTTLHRRNPLDLVHALWADEAGAVAVLAARMIGRPSMVSVMGGELVALDDIGYGAAIGRGGRLTVRLSLRMSDQVTVGSTYLGNLTRAGAPSPDERVVIQPLGVDTAIFHPAGSAPRQPTILFAGSLAPVKDPECAVHAFAELAATRPTARMVVVGSGSLSGRLKRLTVELGIDDRVEFPGRVIRARMPEVYRSASVLCVTSRHEAQSMVAVEAAASGVPIVGTAVGVLPDLGGGAITVSGGPPGAPHEIAAALATILDDPALAARMSVAARTAAVERYDIERTSATLLERYDRLVSRSPEEPAGT